MTLYSTNCPRCKVIEAKLKKTGVDFDIVTDVDKVVEVGKKAGIMSAPILEKNGVYFDFVSAIKEIDNERNI